MRTTFEFSEYVKCGPRVENLFEYLSAMTPRERDLIVNEDFEKLWDDLNRDEKDLFPETKKRVKLLHDHFAPYLPQLLKLTDSYSEEPPWVFPKGRSKKWDRTLLSTALREMKEEGKLEFPSIILMYDKPVVVLHRGTDGCLYSTTYYVVKSEKQIEPLPVESPNNAINEVCLSNDMQNYMWFQIPKDADLKTFPTPFTDKLERALFKIHRDICNIDN